MTVVGLMGMTAGSFTLALLPASLGIVGYVGPLVFLTAGYALFQTANNTATMQGIPSDQRGVLSGLLNLSRHLGLITGSSLMGAVFSIASGTTHIQTVTPDSVVSGMRTTFTVAGFLIVIALAIARGGRFRARLNPTANTKQEAAHDSK